jgi:hypothetical protein
LPYCCYTQTLLQNGKVLIVGGFDSSSYNAQALADAVLYDPSRDTWSRAASMPAPRGDHIAVLLNDGRVLIAFGTDAATGGSSPSPLLYDPTTDLWSPTGAPSAYSAYRGPVLVVLGNGKVLLVGTVACPACASLEQSRAELYDPANGTWGPTAAPLGYPDTATLLANGTVLLTGGSLQQDGPDLPELYDPTADSWSAIPVTPELVGTFALGGRSAVRLQDGTVLLAGGDQCCGYMSTVATARVYDPRTNTLKATADLLAARAAAGAVLLPTGEVLITGGTYTYIDARNNTNVESVQTTELYDPHVGSWTAAGNVSIGGQYINVTLVPGAVLATGFAPAGRPAYQLYRW